VPNYYYAEPQNGFERFTTQITDLAKHLSEYTLPNESIKQIIKKYTSFENLFADLIAMGDETLIATKFNELDVTELPESQQVWLSQFLAAYFTYLGYADKFIVGERALAIYCRDNCAPESIIADEFAKVCTTGITYKEALNS